MLTKQLVSKRIPVGLSGAVLIIWASLLTAVATEWYLLSLVPLLLLAGWWFIADLKTAYLLLVASIPFSIEWQLPGGFATDFPSEPLVLVLLGLFVFQIARNPTLISKRFLLHPISLGLWAHFLWTAVAALNSEAPYVSMKFLLAKSWYIGGYFLVAGILFADIKSIRRMARWVLIPLLATVFITLVKHGLQGFTFEASNLAPHPFYRNHVNYAAILVLFFPFVFWLYQTATTEKKKWYILTLLLLLFAIWVTYTRAAYIALIGALGYLVVLRWKLTRLVGIASVIGIIGFSWYVSRENKFLDFAPRFEKTIAHTEFNSLVSATAKGEDISTMERLYRWVAGGHMIEKHPVFGFGPGTFYFFYKSYTVSNFTTYVSDNPEQSGIHSYYLMTAVEQGVPGLALLLVFFFVLLNTGEKLWHTSKNNQELHGLVQALIQSLVVIFLLLVINDLIETDKVGSFFFMFAAMLVQLDLQNRLPSKDSK